MHFHIHGALKHGIMLCVPVLARHWDFQPKDHQTALDDGHATMTVVTGVMALGVMGAGERDSRSSTGSLGVGDGGVQSRWCGEGAEGEWGPSHPVLY